MYVLMFHSVGNHQSSWNRHWLSNSLEHFEYLCKYLSMNGYTTHFLNEWDDYFSITSKKDPGKIVLTFDDGYLDNWVFVYPILKRYKLKATVFINPEFVDPGSIARPNLDDVHQGRVLLENVETLGFLNWAEIQQMDASGVIDIQSHSMSHNFCFKSDRIIDIYNGQPEYSWLAWLSHKDRKPFSLTENQSSLIPKGYPIFEYGRALGIRKYIPDEDLISQSMSRYGKKLHSVTSVIAGLQELVVQSPGRFETADEMAQRFRYELFESKTILEEKLNKKINYLCWPGGGFNSLSVELAIEAGYKASTIGSSEKWSDLYLKQQHKRIPRIGFGSFLKVGPKHEYVEDPEFLVKKLRARTGNLILRIVMKVNKELWIARQQLMGYNHSIKSKRHVPKK